MPEHDPQAFQELFDSEPADASASETATWKEEISAFKERLAHWSDPGCSRSSVTS
jgi:hypothetical protein